MTVKTCSVQAVNKVVAGSVCVCVCKHACTLKEALSSADFYVYLEAAVSIFSTSQPRSALPTERTQLHALSEKIDLSQNLTAESFDTS